MQTGPCVYEPPAGAALATTRRPWAQRSRLQGGHGRSVRDYIAFMRAALATTWGSRAQRSRLQSGRGPAPHDHKAQSGAPAAPTGRPKARRANSQGILGRAARVHEAPQRAAVSTTWPVGRSASQPQTVARTNSQDQTAPQEAPDANTTHVRVRRPGSQGQGPESTRPRAPERGGTRIREHESVEAQETPRYTAVFRWEGKRIGAWAPESMRAWEHRGAI